MSFLPDFTNVVARLTNGRTLDTSDEALDSAAGFQDGFREYLPLYNEYTGSSLSMEADIQRPYDELREIDFGRLAEVAEQSASVADEFQETRDEINTRVGEVTGWSGDASNAFLAYVQRFQTAAQTVDSELGEIATATGEAVPAAQGVIAEYVDAIGEIDFSGFDSPEIIRILITIEGMAMSVSELIDRLYDGIGDLIGMALPVLGGGGGGLFGGVPVVGDVVDAVSGFVGDMIGEVLDFFGGADDLLALASRLARGYLDASFKQPFENNFQLLNDAVEAARQGVTESFQPMVDAANAVTPAAFAQLGSPPEDNPNQQGQPPPPSDENHDQSGQPPGQTQPSQPTQPAQSPGGSGGTVSPPVTPPVGTPPVGTPPVTAPPGGGGDVPAPEPVPQPQPQPMPPGPGDGPGGRPDDLPQGAGWVSDPSQLPDGWTVDPETGELLPPGAPGGEGDPEVHSPEGQDVLDGDVTTLPAPDGGLGTPSEVTMQIGDMTITISGDGSGEAIGLTLTDADGDSARYEIRIGENGNPELVPVEDAGGFKHEPPIMTTTPGGPADTPTVTAAPAGPAVSPPFATEGPVGAGTPGFAADVPAAAAAAAGAPAFVAGGPVGAPADVPAAAAPPPGLQPATTAPAADGFATGAVPAGGGPSFAAGQVPGGPGVGSGGMGTATGEVPVGGPSVATGAVSPGGSSHATGQVAGGPSFAAGPGDGGFAVSGSVSGGGGGAEGSAQLASASDAGAPSGPAGTAQLPSAAEDARAAHGGTGTGTGSGSGSGAGGAPFMPMGGGMAGSGGDEERRGGGTWQVPGTDVFEPEERTAARIRGVLGEDD